MKKIISIAVLSTALLGFCGCGSSDQPMDITTTSPITLQSTTSAYLDEVMFSFKFDIDSEYTHTIVTVNNGYLLEHKSSERLDNLDINQGSGFFWLPEEGQSETTVIVVQICNGDKTVHCGTISLVEKKSLLDNGETTFVAVLDSDDGMQIRQGKDQSIVICE